MLDSFLCMQSRFGAGQWSFLGLCSEKKWSSISEDRPQGEWDKMTELMMFKFAESGHPVFHVHATSPLPRGQLKSKGGGKLSIHCCADLEIIETHNYFCKSAQSLRNSRRNVRRICKHFMIERWNPLWEGSGVSHSCQAWSRQTCLWKVMTVLTKIFYCRNTENEQILYGCRIPECCWTRTVFRDEKILQNSHNWQIQWLVVSTLCQVTKQHMNQKVGSEGTPKLDPYWKLEPVDCTANMELRSESCLWTRTILSPGSEFFFA